MLKNQKIHYVNRSAKQIIAAANKKIEQEAKARVSKSEGVKESKPQTIEEPPVRRVPDIMRPFVVKGKYGPLPGVPRIASEDPEKVLCTLLGGLMGEFENDPNLGMIAIDTLVGVIPVADQICDTRDLTAHLYFMIVKNDYSPTRWIGLAFTLIGAIPEIGTLIKSASKLIKMGAGLVAVSFFAELLKILPDLSEIIRKNWRTWTSIGLDKWREVLGQASSLSLGAYKATLDYIRKISPR